MYSQIVITVVSNDKPGIVKYIAEHITAHQGEWLESKLANLAGKFVGVIKARLPEAALAALTEQLSCAQDGISIVVEPLADQQASAYSGRLARFHVLGPDRKGIVEEISQALLKYNINVEEIETRLTSEAYTGTPLFEMEGMVKIPENTDIHALNDNLNSIADMLGVDISIPDFFVH